MTVSKSPTADQHTFDPNEKTLSERLIQGESVYRPFDSTTIQPKAASYVEASASSRYSSLHSDLDSIRSLFHFQSHVRWRGSFEMSPSLIDNGVPTQVQIFGRISSGPLVGKIAAVACDANGNLAISGGTGGAINSVDLLGNGVATPCMIYGAMPNGKRVAVAVDAFGNLCAATVGTGGGNPNTIVDLESQAFAQTTPVQIFARAPNGLLIAVPINTSNALYNSVHPGTTPTSLVDTTANGVPTPVILCGRTPSGAIVAVSLDSAGRLCISGSGSSGSKNVVDVYPNGDCRLVEIFGRNLGGRLQSVVLDVNGNLALS
jgi:hypothetical protein